MRTHDLLLVSFLSVAVFGCGDDRSSGGSSGSGAAGAGGAGGSGGSGAGTIDPTPILDRPPLLSHDCTEERPMAQGEGPTGAKLEGLVAAGGSFFSTHEADTLTLSPIDLSGDLGDSVALVSEAFSYRRSLTLADGTDIVSLWTSTGGSEQLVYARSNTALDLVDGPTVIADTASSSTSIAHAIPTPDGLAILYGSLVGSETELRFMTLGSDGQPTGEAVTIANLGEVYAASGSMALTEDGGVAITYVAGSIDSSVYFVVLDADGSPRFAPRRVSRAAGDGLRSGFGAYPRNNIAAVGDSFWIAFTEEELDVEASEGHVIIRIAVVDAEGNAELHALEESAQGVESRAPTFVAFGDRIGLAWTKGNLIWICGGCVSDHDLHFVLLDPATLVPASNVVTQLHMTNGITAPLVAASGEDLLTSGNLDFHATTIAATGAMRCAAQ